MVVDIQEARLDDDAALIRRSLQDGEQFTAAYDTLTETRALVQTGTTWERDGGDRESRQWVSGARDGAIIEPGETDLTLLAGCPSRNAATQEEVLPDGSTREVPCVPSPAYRADLPTTTEAMRAFLDRLAASYPDRNSGAFDEGSELVTGWVQPEARAALFRAMATIPGVDVVRDVPTITGARGVAVASTYDGWRQELVFDPGTHEVIGLRRVATRASEGLAAGTEVYASGVVASGVVAQVRLRPDGTRHPGRIVGAEDGAAEGDGD